MQKGREDGLRHVIADGEVRGEALAYLELESFTFGLRAEGE